MKVKIMWSLCAGLGGDSEAFLNRPDWTVVRIDNNELLFEDEDASRCLRMHDLLKWRDWVPNLIDEYGRPDLIVAGPPCLEFSNAYSAPKGRWIRENPGEPYEPDMSLVWACNDIINFVQPPMWIVENVAGACPYFEEVFGAHEQKVAAFILWGVFPNLILPTGWTHSKFEGDTWSSDPLRANRRAKWPLELSQALLTAVSAQSTLNDWI